MTTNDLGVAASSTHLEEPYAPPAVKSWGTVHSLTGTGCTNPGEDGMYGSILHSKGNPPPNARDCREV